MHEKQMKRKNNQEKAITLIALVVTVVVLMILAGISVGILTGENGLINRASKGKEETEIAEEKEMLQTAVANASGKDVYGNIEESGLQNELDDAIGIGKSEVTDIGTELEVIFKESNRYYIVDKNGNIGEAEDIIEDKYPGDIAKDEEGNILDGSEEEPYEIWCIEDLVAFSRAINNNEINSSSTVLLMRNLNFKSKISYTNYNSKYKYDEDKVAYIEDEASDKNLMELCTTDFGFISIGIDDSRRFQGTFEGNGHNIDNIYVNTNRNAGLFGVTYQATINNLSVSGNINSNEEYAGGIVGWGVATSYYNCNNYANIYGKKYTGGIVGHGSWAEATMENCHNSGNIISNYYVGGIAGSYGGIINKCSNIGNIKSDDGNAGGILGQASGKTKIINCYNTGNVLSEYCSAGGILASGYDESEIENCYNNGDITTGASTLSYGYACGIVGNKSRKQKITNCYTTGRLYSKVTSKRTFAIGAGNEEIENCYYLNNQPNEDITIEEGVKVKEENFMKSQEFLDELNQNINGNGELLKWTLETNKYPTFIK